jgi:hypothetical protein
MVADRRREHAGRLAIPGLRRAGTTRLNFGVTPEGDTSAMLKFVIRNF